jgi:hypothetical protein
MDDELEHEAAEAARPNPSLRPDQWPDPEAPAEEAAGPGAEPPGYAGATEGE